MTEISDKAVWAVCQSITCSWVDGCIKCSTSDGCQERAEAEGIIQTVLRAVAEHPVGLPEGWIAGPCNPR